MLGAWASGATVGGCGTDVGGLLEPDRNGLRLPPGFTSRVVAVSGQRPVKGSSYAWHFSPDGGATFATPDGGWVYVSNAELGDGAGGVGALRFAADGRIQDAYSILEGTDRNCAGGPTPWGTWLSCEEVAWGRVWECDPFGVELPVVRPALGVFNHEAVCVDPNQGLLYLTEDQPDGRLYRFRPAAPLPDLTGGTLEVLQVADGTEGAVRWLPIPDPEATGLATRRQVPESTAFRGGEGIWYHEGIVYFTTKGDDRVWAYDTQQGRLWILYDAETLNSPRLTGVDNVVVSSAGDVLVAEDGGDMEIIALTATGATVPVVRIDGHWLSEVTGPAFSPDEQRLYFSSQRGSLLGEPATYEVRGPFRALFAGG